MTIADRLTHTVVAMCLALGFAGSQSDSGRVDDVALRADRFLTAAVDSGFNGSVLIALNDRIVLHRGYGWSDSAGVTAADAETSYWIASVTKQFTATAILKLVEEGKLDLDHSIADYFESVPEDKASITVRQLLTHTAGVAQHYAADGITDRTEAVAALLEAPLAYPPGEGYGYTNDAYNLLAALIEQVCGHTYEEYLTEQCFEPAGMTHTGFWGRDGASRTAYTADLVEWNLEPNWGFRGATGMFSSTGDLYRWCLALNRGKVISAESLRSMQTRHVDGQPAGRGVGYGWFITETSRGTRSIWARGYEGFGHGAVLATFPEEGVTMITASNSGAVEGYPVSHQLAMDLESLVFSQH